MVQQSIAGIKENANIAKVASAAAKAALPQGWSSYERESNR